MDDGSGRILVTGATGFLGGPVAEALARAGHRVVRGARVRPASVRDGEDWVAYGDVGRDARWDEALAGVRTVVHLAGLAHLADEEAEAAAGRFRRVNSDGTAALAEAAARGGVRRLVLMSTALVHGHGTGERPVREEDAPAPQTAYAASKLEAERRLREVARGSGLEAVIVRPPMVYGPGARGNFRRLVALVARGVPIPLGAATAPKSFIGIDNLASAVVRCATHPAAAGGTFLVSDAETTSTADLIRHIAEALGRRAWLLPVPAGAMRGLLRVTGRGRDAARLFEPLALDTSRIREGLGWTPPVSLAEGVRRAVAGRGA